MPQLATASKGPEDAFKKMGGRPFVMECKFDGERVQVTGRTLRFIVTSVQSADCPSVDPTQCRYTSPVPLSSTSVEGAMITA